MRRRCPVVIDPADPDIHAQDASTPAGGPVRGLDTLPVPLRGER
ncbi:hypothetical protein [Micromonospora sp. CPCC 205561]